MKNTGTLKENCLYGSRPSYTQHIHWYYCIILILVYQWMCCVYDGLEPYNHYEPQQDTNNPNPRKIVPTIQTDYILVLISL
jgi:hypothetical protein